MSPERWRRVNELFHRASELAPDARSAFLQSECSDEERKVVQSMLDSESHDGLLDQPPWEALASAMAAGQAPSQAPHPDPPPNAFEPGRILAGRYRIRKFLSRGGMGEVYEAQDLEFNDRVALKTVLPAIAAEPGILARFKQEIQLSRKITHPNVCRVFDLSRDPLSGTSSDQPTYFLTMELLPGETLAARLERDGALTVNEGLPLLEQMASALDAAHAAGVIHRDLKPSNVMLAPGSGACRAVITDFGLARSVSPEGATASQSARLMGTFEYMAPELFTGRPASVATDIYAFAVLAQRLLVHEVPTPVSQAIAAALDRDPSRRPASAGEFVRGLQETKTPPAIRRAPSARKRVVLAATFLLVAGLSLYLGALRYRGQGAGMTPGSLIYLMDLNNATKDAELDAAGTLLRTQLRQSAHLQLLDDARLSRIRALIATKNADPATAERELAMQAGASLVVFSTLTRTADSYDVAVEIQQPGENPSAVRNRWRRSWQARGKTQIFGAIHDAGVWIRTIAGESAVNLASHDVPPEEAASSSWEALSLYQQAQGFKGRRDVDSAIAMLRRAILIDPDFALARVRLADYLSGIRRQEEAYEQYELAITAAAKRRLSNWEQLQLRGNYALDLGNYREAEGVFTELRSLYPHDYLVLHNLAGSVRYQGRLEQSVQLELETLKRAADYTGAITAAVQDYLRLGRLDEAEVMARRIDSLGLPFMSAEYQGVVQVHRGNFPAARALFEKEATDPAPINRSRAASLLAALEAETGAYGRALTLYQDGLAADLAAGLPEQAAQKHLALAFLYFRKNDKAAARIHALEAVRRLRFLVVYRRAGSILARSGSPSEARTLMNELKRWPGPLAEAARRYILAEVLLAERDYGGALREFRALDEADTPLLPREYLARAYAAAGDPDRALFLYQSLLRSWQPFWLYADGELPALRTSVLLEYATLAGQHGHAEQARSALSQFSEIRSQADSDLPETASAARVAAGVTHAPTANRKDKP